MPDWRCPACGGGFPDHMIEPDTGTGFGGRVADDRCPWCHVHLGRVERSFARSDIEAVAEAVDMSAEEIIDKITERKR